MAELQNAIQSGLKSLMAGFRVALGWLVALLLSLPYSSLALAHAQQFGSGDRKVQHHTSQNQIFRAEREKTWF